MYPYYPLFGKRMVSKEQILTCPPQHQDRQPGFEYMMNPLPISENPDYKGSGKLAGKVAIISGGDSGIGRAAALAFAKEGARLSIVYLNEDRDAEWTKRRIEALGGESILIRADLKNPQSSKSAVARTVKKFGRLDIVVNNCAVQYVRNSLLDISDEQLMTTFQTNIFSYFYLTREALPHLKPGSSIINTASVTAYRGSKNLIDYSATKGAVVSFTRALSQNLIDRGIRVNAVAPGPIWTPLIPATFTEENVGIFGSDMPIKRPGQPFELAPAYVYLASDDSGYVSGQTLHVGGGEMVES
ncbi:MULTISPECIES: SDR family oxidoreductase [unclassified Sporolactobacillus]|uniref:SDR family oxidoreductase n=1 Tax=unclassified Sporolactobacillus TaxID=2628533 RepID=UPI002367F9F6|nr:SDR family oxidoreductase [Sporolactobacillus sp. CQH2019]MDD9147239.1 SDR family oxidoreductase [Sporolactobacillus sp. CQH2019]